MIQPIYTSVSNADIVPCGKKGLIIKSDPIPLLRNNYLGEYRTELEKAKVRKNLGISDEHSLQWGNLTGFIESQEDLTNYVESKWKYENELYKDLTNTSEALDYILYFISNAKDNQELIESLNERINNVSEELSNTKITLLESINKNVNSINQIELNIIAINQSITKLNEDLKSINVDANILNWIKNSVNASKTISLENDNTLEIIISDKEDNAILIDNGIYIKDYSEDIAKIPTIEENIKNNSEAIKESLLLIEESDEYQTDLSDDTEAPTTLGGITKGTKVSNLKGKTVSEILDIMLFPTTVRPLVQPSIYYSSIPNLVLVGSEVIKPLLNFTKGDSGGETKRTEIVLDPLNLETTSNTYDLLGKYVHKASVEYAEGEPLINNKGEVTNIKVNAGSLETSLTVETTYPWYTSEVGKPNVIQTLVSFGISKELQISLSGEAVIKLPGLNSKISSFMVDAGLGFLNVDMNGWKESEETINNITYKVWTKMDSYSSILPHKIKFTLAL